MILSRVALPRAWHSGSPTAPLTDLAGAIDTESDDARSRLGALYVPPHRTWLRLNFVTSVDGSVVGPDGGSNSLTSTADRMLLGVIRSTADVVLVGASSVRAEGLHLPRRARLAIITATGDLGDLVVPEDVVPHQVIVLGPVAALADVARRHPALRAEYVAVNATANDTDAAGPDAWVRIGGVVDALHSRGLLAIVCEGGPRLAGSLLDAGLVDELCLTTSPLLSPSHLPLARGRSGGSIPLELSQLLVDDQGSTYARWFVPGR